MKFIYTVWLRDTTLSSDDPDYEWPACFIVDSADEAHARRWGDYLAEKYASSHSHCIISQSTERLEESKLPGVGSLPVVLDGQQVTDEELGW